MSRVHQVEDGDTYTVGIEDLPMEIKVRCCDCGLIHWVLLTSRPKGYAFGIRGDNRATAAVRGWEKRKARKA